MSDDRDRLPGAASPVELEWAERSIPALGTDAVDHALRLLARLLVRAALTDLSNRPAEPQKPLDVATSSKVGSDRE